MQVTIYIDEELHMAFQRAAVEAKCKVTHLVADAMRDYLRHNNLPGAPANPNPSRSFRANDLNDGISLQILEVLSAHSQKLSEIIEGISELKDGPFKPLKDPQIAEASEVAIRILNEVSAAGMTGVDFQAHMRNRGYDYAISRHATASLQRRGILHRRKTGWVLTRFLPEGKR